MECTSSPASDATAQAATGASSKASWGSISTQEKTAPVDPAARPPGCSRMAGTGSTSSSHEVVCADGLAAVCLGALRRLLEQPVQVAVERLERVARGVATCPLEDDLGLARDHERLLRLLRHLVLPGPMRGLPLSGVSDGVLPQRDGSDHFPSISIVAEAQQEHRDVRNLDAAAVAVDGGGDRVVEGSPDGGAEERVVGMGVEKIEVLPARIDRGPRKE